jgi:hypothetical protein
MFTSTPNSQASEGLSYGYQVAASGTGVTFFLSSAPTGATLSGSTISWIPTAAQSRTANSFTVTAIASGGPSATQSWSVTPNGTIRVSHVDTLWNSSGSTKKAFDWSPVVSFLTALVPQSDGSFKSVPGVIGSDGTLEFSNVPAGYYWLRLGPRDTYWTSSSSFDVGNDYFALNFATTPTTSTTYISLSFTALEPTLERGRLQFNILDSVFPPFSASTNPNSMTYSGVSAINGNGDFSGVKNAFAGQYEPVALGSVAGYVLGPGLMLSNLSLNTGGHNAISGALNPRVPASINLSIAGAAWASQFDHAAPVTAKAQGGDFSLSVQPYIAADGPNVAGSKPIDLLWVEGNFSGFLNPACSSNLPLTSDLVAGTVQYSDPFPVSWRRTFSLCQSALVSVPMPDGKSLGITLMNSQTTAPPAGIVKPLVSAVQNPKINGADLLTAATINSTPVTLSWDSPSIGTVFGYSVQIMAPITLPTGTVGYRSLATLSMAKTSMSVPPDLLRSGQTYLFLITSLVDGKANMETTPHRSLLPVASAQLVSAPVTITY